MAPVQQVHVDHSVKYLGQEEILKEVGSREMFFPPSLPHPPLFVVIWTFRSEGKQSHFSGPYHPILSPSIVRTMPEGGARQTMNDY